MRRPRKTIALLATLVVAAGCSSTRPPARDPGKVMPVKRVAVPGKLYATKGRTLYRFSGTNVTSLFKGRKVKDPGAGADGARIAFAQLQGENSIIVLSDVAGTRPQAITPASAPEGKLWALAPAFSSDGARLVYLSDRGKQPSSPDNLQPNDLGIWVYDIGSGQSQQLVSPLAYSGGDSDPAFRPGSGGQLLYTTYSYGGSPPQPAARLTWMSTQTRASFYLSPDLQRNFAPAFSPDGRFVAYIHAGASSDDLYVMPLSPTLNREPTPYPTDAAVLVQSGMVSQPVWAPDGSAIAFLMLVNGSFDLYVLPISTGGAVHATGQAQAITHGSFLDADSRLAWSP